MRRLRLLALLCLFGALPLAGQVGTWVYEREAQLWDTPSRLRAVITLAPDSTFTATLAHEAPEAEGWYVFTAGRWWILGPALCVAAGDSQPVCTAFHATPGTLHWGPFPFQAAGPAVASEVPR